jgi:hypothetical protein
MILDHGTLDRTGEKGSGLSQSCNSRITAFIIHFRYTGGRLPGLIEAGHGPPTRTGVNNMGGNFHL